MREPHIVCGARIRYAVATCDVQLLYSDLHPICGAASDMRLCIVSPHCMPLAGDAPGTDSVSALEAFGSPGNIGNILDCGQGQQSLLGIMGNRPTSPASLQNYTEDFASIEVLMEATRSHHDKWSLQTKPILMLLTEPPKMVSSYNLHIGCGIRIQYVVTAYWMRASHIVCGSRILYAVLHFALMSKNVTQSCSCCGQEINGRPISTWTVEEMEKHAIRRKEEWHKYACLVFISFHGLSATKPAKKGDPASLLYPPGLLECHISAANEAGMAAYLLVKLLALDADNALATLDALAKGSETAKQERLVRSVPHTVCGPRIQYAVTAYGMQ